LPLLLLSLFSFSINNESDWVLIKTPTDNSLPLDFGAGVGRFNIFDSSVTKTVVHEKFTDKESVVDTESVEQSCSTALSLPYDASSAG